MLSVIDRPRGATINDIIGAMGKSIHGSDRLVTSNKLSAIRHLTRLRQKLRPAGYVIIRRDDIYRLVLATDVGSTFALDVGNGVLADILSAINRPTGASVDEIASVGSIRHISMLRKKLRPIGYDIVRFADRYRVVEVPDANTANSSFADERNPSMRVHS
jgi:hypothetical protein